MKRTRSFPRTPKFGRSLSRWSLCTLTGAGLPLAGHAAAPPPVEAEQLPPITVTGYAGQTPQADTAAQSVLPDAVFEAGGPGELRSLTALSPNTASFDGNNARTPRFSLRGFRENNFLAGEPVFGLYVDDVPYVDLASRGLTFFDVQSLELLRGPQGTLFGAAGPAGVMLLTTRAPQSSWGGHGRFTYGSYDAFSAQAGGGGPVVDERLAFNLSGLWDFRNGYVRNLARDTRPDDRETLAGRFQARWTPSERWEITAAVDGARFRDGFVPTFYPGHDPGLFDVRRNYDGFVDTDQFGQSLRVRYQTPEVRLTAVTAHRKWEQDLRQDFDFTEHDVLYGFSRPDLDQWSQEVRAESADPDARLRWLTGFFFAHRDLGADSGSTEVPPRTIILPGSPPVTVAHSTLRTVAATEARTYALFGQLTYELVERLDVVGGLRVTWDERRLERAGTFSSPDASLGGFPIGPVSFPTASYAVAEDFSDVQPKVGLSYRWTDSTSTYFSFSTGYQSGGFNASSDTPAGAAFGPARSRHYEIGLKSTCWETRLAGNVALFLIDTDHYQVHRLSRQDPTQAYVQNAESARTLGAEVEAFYRPAAGWELNAGLGYAHAEYDRYFDPVNRQRLDGKRISFVPEFTATAGAAYRFPCGFYVQLEVQGVGNYPLTEDNTAEQDAFALLHARLGYERGRWGVHLFGRNLLDEEYASNALDLRNAAAPDLLIYQPGDPLTLGVALTARF